MHEHIQLIFHWGVGNTCSPFNFRQDAYESGCYLYTHIHISSRKCLNLSKPEFINTVRSHKLMIGISSTHPGHNQNLGIWSENSAEQSQETAGLTDYTYLAVH